jgi:hypothetical protein
MGWVQNASPEVDVASNYPTIISVCISMTIFMTAVVSLRIYVRALFLKLMGIDDWTIIFSAVSLARHEALVPHHQILTSSRFAASSITAFA